jgi:hypothetical protein
MAGTGRMATTEGTSSLGSGPHVQVRPTVKSNGTESTNPLPANCQFAAFPLLLAVGSSRARASSIRFYPGPTCRARKAIATARGARVRVDPPVIGQLYAGRHSSVFTLVILS